MAGRDRMTIEEVVRQVLRDEHADVIRESVRGRGDAKATVGPSCCRFPCKLEDLQREVDRLTRERSLVRTQPRP